MIRVALPAHLRALAGVSGEVQLEPAGPATLNAVIDALEARYPALRGTLRDANAPRRRAFIRFFAAGQDWSHLGLDDPLPEAIAGGAEVLRVVGAMAGG